jgi:hypothetical protein
MAGTIVTDRIESDASYASSVNIASPLIVSSNANFDSGTLFVDSVNNRVGVGKENPSTKLHVESAGVNYITTRDSTSGGIAGLICQNGSDTRGIRINNASLELYDHSAALARVIVDASGRVTMPYQPAFSGGLVGASGNVTADPLVFNSALLNQGSCYNTSTGLFTCPVAGVYRVSCSTTTFINGYAAVNISLRKNGSDIDVAYGKGYWEGSLSSSYLGKSASWLISCAASDNLAVGGTVYREPTASYCTLTIELVG